MNICSTDNRLNNEMICYDWFKYLLLIWIIIWIIIWTTTWLDWLTIQSNVMQCNVMQCNVYSYDWDWRMPFELILSFLI